MPISDRRKWKVNKSSNEILKIVTNFLAQKKARLILADSRRLEATMGSGLKTRVIGGMFVSKDILPVKIILLMNDVAGETEVDATIEDNLGPGIKAGIVGKYQGYIKDLFDDLARVLQS
jgi:hypothetical protein